MDVVDCTSFKKLLKDERGRFIAVFTASWCGYCRSLMRELNQSSHDLRLILVDISDEGCWDDFFNDTATTVIYTVIYLMQGPYGPAVTLFAIVSNVII
ncbi:MAG: thioredoxin domain-containing protein, partial [Candidatus Methanomethylicaceae archaeon]